MDILKRAFAAVSQRPDWIPDWLFSLLIVAAFILVAWWIHRLVFLLVTRVVQTEGLFRRSVVSRTRHASRLLFLMLGMASAIAISAPPFVDA